MIPAFCRNLEINNFIFIQSIEVNTCLKQLFCLKLNHKTNENAILYFLFKICHWKIAFCKILLYFQSLFFSYTNFDVLQVQLLYTKNPDYQLKRTCKLSQHFAISSGHSNGNLVCIVYSWSTKLDLCSTIWFGKIIEI